MEQNYQAEKKAFLDPAIIFLILAGIIGVFYCIAIPYGAGFDEEAHIVRIYDISGNNFFPNRNPPTLKHTLTFSEFHDLSYQRRHFQTPAFDMLTQESLSQKFSRTEDDVIYGYITNSIYSPIIFLPQAIIARVFWRNFDFPILPIIMLQRLAGLLFYMIGCYLAIRFIPFGKWALMALALSPMALFQAATLNTDGFLNAASFLFVGLTLCVYVKASPAIKPGWIWALVMACLLLGSGKLGAVVLLPLLLLPISRLKSKKWIAILLLGAFFALVLNVGWTALALPNSSLAESASKDAPSSLPLLLSQTAAFLWNYVLSIIASFGLYTRNWMASYGYWVADVPVPVYWFYTLTLLLSTFLGHSIVEKFEPKARLFTLGIFILSSTVVIGMYYTVHYHPGVVMEMRQGRYSIPYVPLLLIAVCGLIPLREGWKKVLEAATLGCLLVALGYYSFGLYATYYTDCGYDVYAGGRCTLPIYKNLEIARAPEIKLTPKGTVRQEFTALCNGLESVYVIVKSAPKNGGLLKFSLLDANQKSLTSKEIPTAQIPLGKYLKLAVPLQPASKGTTYQIALEAPGAASPNGFGILFHPDIKIVGPLFVADQPTRGNLIFHYACTSP